jgi:hypothetical protein
LRADGHSFAISMDGRAIACANGGCAARQTVRAFMTIAVWSDSVGAADRNVTPIGCE